MEKQSTKSSLDKTTKQQKINNKQNFPKNQGENIKNMDNGISLRNNMMLSTADKNPVEIAGSQKNRDNTFTETRKSRRLKKFFPLDIEDFDFKNNIKDDEIEEFMNNISCNVNVNKGKQKKIKKEDNFNSVTTPSFGLNESLKELHKKVKPINNIKTFDENIEMHEGTTNVKQDSRLKTIKQNVFVEPKMKLKTEIDQSITRPSMLEDNFNPKKTVMNKSALTKPHSKTNTKLYKTDEENTDIDYMHYKKQVFLTSLGLIEIKKGKTNSQANEDCIKPKPSQQTSQYLKELSIPNEDNTKKTYRTRPVTVKKKHTYSKTFLYKREDNQMLHIPILRPEILLGSAVHPERVCKPNCRMCTIKFGSLDIPHHITEIKNPITPDFESKCLTNHGVKSDSCLCGPCFRIIKKGKYDITIQQDICIVTTCYSVATETFQSPPMNTIRSNLIEKGIEFKTWDNETKSIAICELHLKEILKLTECHLCGSQSQVKFNWRMVPLHIYQKVFDIAGVSIKFNAKSLICESCHFYFINHIMYKSDFNSKIYIELRCDLLISICKYKNVKLPELFFADEWPWIRVQPKGTPCRRTPTAAQMSFILSMSETTPMETWRRTLNQLTSDDIRWTVIPQDEERAKWVSWEERIALATAAAADLLPGVPEELGDVEQEESSDTDDADADDTAVVRPKEILGVGGAGQTLTKRRDDVVEPAVPILTLPKTVTTKWMQLAMPNVDDIICKTTTALAYTTTAATETAAATTTATETSTAAATATATATAAAAAAASAVTGKRAAADDGDGQPVPPSKLAKFSDGSGQIFAALADASETDIIYPEHGQPASADGAILRNFVRK